MANSHRIDALPARGESSRALALRRRMHVALAIAAALLPSAHAAGAQDAAAGRGKAIQCQACHGLDGVAKVPGAPHLAGQVQEYLVKAMRDYKSGARKDQMMAVAMRGITEEDMADLAAYYAALPPKTGE